MSEWLLKLFGFDKAAEKAANAGEWTIGSMIVTAFKAVKKWLFGIFGFGTDEEGKDKPKQVKEAEGFSLAKILGDTIRKVWDWFKDLLDIDLMSIAKKIPGYDTFMSIFGSNDKTPEELKTEQARRGRRKKKARPWSGASPSTRARAPA